MVIDVDKNDMILMDVLLEDYQLEFLSKKGILLGEFVRNKIDVDIREEKEKGGNDDE